MIVSTPNIPKNATDKNKIVVVQPATGFDVAYIIIEYNVINIDISIMNTVIIFAKLYPTSVNKIRESTASPNLNLCSFLSDSTIA